VKIFQIASLPISLLLVGCAHPLFASHGCPSLERLKSSDARSDAMRAARVGDRRLLMIGGFVGTIPGASGTNHQTVMIEGSGDDSGLACYRLRSLAEQYALRYNQTMLALSD
jgi:hypothetical protein